MYIKMSGQYGQGTPARGRKSSPSSMKQGPMKATIPMASLLKQSSNFVSSNSPNLSPTSCWKNRVSPDHSLGQRSPGSGVSKVKARTLGNNTNGPGSSIRRTASLDTIYLKGHWPKDQFYWQTGSLQIDKGTQTDDNDWLDSRKIHSIAEYDDKIDKMLIKQRLQRSNNQQSVRSLPSPGSITAFTADHTLSASSQTNTPFITPPLQRAHPVNIPIKPLSKPPMRNSVEGLNQEIEGLVLKSGFTHSIDKNHEFDKFCQVTPEGHRAPLPDLFRSTKSVNTQTPLSADFLNSCQSSGPPSRDSLSPLYPGQMESSPSDAGGSQGSSPDQDGKLGTSPHMFMARGPPDGCERVHLKCVDERRSLTLDHAPQPSTFQLKPSLGSAFQILQPNLHSSTDQNLPLVPSQKDLM